MGYMATPEALKLISHYFGELQPGQLSALQQVWCEGVVTPAALEAVCAECEDVDSLLRAVKVLVKLSSQEKEQQQSTDTAAAGLAMCLSSLASSPSLQDAAELFHSMTS